MGAENCVVQLALVSVVTWMSVFMRVVVLARCSIAGGGRSCAAMIVVAIDKDCPPEAFAATTTP